MGGAELVRKRPDSEVSSFPQIVAWCSLVLALLLFFTSTTPALRERATLRATAADLQSLRTRLEDAIAHALPGTPQARKDEDDLQSVLVAIDRIGWTPAELLQSYPEPIRRGAPSEPEPDAPR